MRRVCCFKFVLLLFSLAMFCAAMAIASPAQTFTSLANFNGTNGTNPAASLIQAADGNFYGTTSDGGANGGGTVFKVTAAGTLTALYSFCAQNGCPDGAAPQAGLVQGRDGNFYGTTSKGGANGGADCLPRGCGSVFKITPDGSTLTTLYSFAGADGNHPMAGLVQGSDGNFYGTTSSGGDNSFGTVFSITSTGTFTTLYSFQDSDGSFPEAGLVQGNDGNFYGTTASGGGNESGTVFKITPAGTLTTLYSFCPQPQTGCTDGAVPDAGVVQGSDGNFYGTTSIGGVNSVGTAFQVTAAGTLTTLYSFCSQTGCTDGAAPAAGLVQATDGNFYGTTSAGGASQTCSGGCGTVFEITTGGALTTLYSFCSLSNCADGESPYAGLVQGTNGAFYGTTIAGGTGGCNGGCGTVFSLSVGLSPFVETQPTSGGVGAPVIILGTTLTGATGVTFNGTPASFNVVSPTQITTNVPAGATTGLVQVTGTPSGTLTSNATFQITSPVQFVPVAPCRLVDTRTKNGGSGPIQGGTFESFNLPQAAQQGKNCPTLDLSSAAAYSLNVTVVPQVPLGYLTVWPTGEIMPGVSTMNSVDGRVKANAAIVPSGSNAVSVFASNTTDLVLDIDGYFVQAGPSTMAFYPLPPCRVADTRNSNEPHGLGPPSMTGGVARDFPVLESTCFPMGINPAAYSLNFTVAPHVSLGYLTVWPAGQNQPVVSTLNAVTGTVVANAAIVPAGTDGDIDVVASNDTDLVIDVNGYFAPPGQGGLSLYPVSPCRVLDTRHVGNGQPFSGELTVDVVDSVCAPPSTAQAYVFSATVVPSFSLGYLTLWPDGGQQPGVSTLNAVDGSVTSNMAIVPNIDGSTDAFASNLTQLILDISSYFAP